MFIYPPTQHLGLNHLYAHFSIAYYFFLAFAALMSQRPPLNFGDIFLAYPEFSEQVFERFSNESQFFLYMMGWQEIDPSLLKKWTKSCRSSRPLPLLVFNIVEPDFLKAAYDLLTHPFLTDPSVSVELQHRGDHPDLEDFPEFKTFRDLAVLQRNPNSAYLDLFSWFFMRFLDYYKGMNLDHLRHCKVETLARRGKEARLLERKYSLPLQLKSEQFRLLASERRIFLSLVNQQKRNRRPSPSASPPSLETPAKMNASVGKKKTSHSGLELSPDQFRSSLTVSFGTGDPASCCRPKRKKRTPAVIFYSYQMKVQIHIESPIASPSSLGFLLACHPWMINRLKHLSLGTPISGTLWCERVAYFYCHHNLTLSEAAFKFLGVHLSDSLLLQMYLTAPNHPQRSKLLNLKLFPTKNYLIQQLKNLEASCEMEIIPSTSQP